MKPRISIITILTALTLAACETAPNQTIIYGPSGEVRGETQAGDRGVMGATVMSEQDMILESQQWLNAAGYNAGVEDGLIGPRTRRAVQVWQADHALVPDGVVDMDLLERLRASAGARRTPQQTNQSGWVNPDR